MEYMKQQTLKKRRTRTKVRKTKNNMKRRKSYKKRVIKLVMKGG
jgi:hypothetical protein